MQEKILVTGACGQLGTEIVAQLRQRYGTNQVLATDQREGNKELVESGPFQTLDVSDRQTVGELITAGQYTQIYHLAALLSGTGEKKPDVAWDVNIQGYMNVLDPVKASGKPTKIYFPSSIAAFGPNTPKVNTPQHTVTDPTTVYGITKLVGERLSEYYCSRYGLDIRSLRYPGIISYKTEPGGGTTDYAVEIFFEAVKKGNYQCFLTENTYLPMMYMPDALKATFDLMDAPAEQVKIRSSYNLAAFSFSPIEIAAAIQQHMPDFSMSYKPDFRQGIADSWPQSIDDSAARADWGWQPAFTFEAMVADMLHNIQQLSA